MKFIDNLRELIDHLEIAEKRPLLIGIDGRPCAGKSILADALIEELPAVGLFLDDFLIPPNDWADNISPGFPFPFIRYSEFLMGVRKLAQGEIFQYLPYDWTSKKLSESKTVDPKNIIIVEGVSTLNEDLIPYFHKKIWVVSNKNNEFDAICRRESNSNINIWIDLCLPSVNLGKLLHGKEQIFYTQEEVFRIKKKLIYFWNSFMNTAVIISYLSKKTLRLYVL